MKNLKYLLALATALSIVCTVNATVQFIDDFNVTTGGGNLGYYNSHLSQSGPLSPITWRGISSPITLVTNAGPYAGKLYIDIDSVRPDFGLNDSIGLDDFTMKFTFERSGSISYFRFYCCNDSAGSRSDFVQFYGLNQIASGNDASGYFVSGTYPEFSDPIEPKMVISRITSTSVWAALFINNKAIVMDDDPFSVFARKSTRSTPNNYIDFYGRNDAGVHLTIDDLTFFSPDNGFDVSAWTDDSDSGISSSKTYTHTVNLFGPTSVVNGVTFYGASTASGSDWEMYTASGNAIAGHHNTASQINVTGASTNLLLDFFYKDSDSTAVTINGLTAGATYIFTIYGMGFDPAGRVSAFASSSGAAITNISCDTYGRGNGIIVKHTYVAPSNGVFTISTTQVSGSWHWYAFSNESIPEPFLFTSLILFFLFLFRKK